MNTTKDRLIQKLLLNKKGKKQNGFTLIELMVVIAIVGVLSAVGLPELLKAQESAKDSAALQETVAAAKTCSMDILAGSTSYIDIRTADMAAVEADDGTPTTWDYVTAAKDACEVDTETTPESTITGAGPNKTHTILITDGVPAKPVTTDTDAAEDEE